ncbi:hypothetical protein BRADI_5g12557v3 [Brachypodium distachyon]|uniref:Pentacotripeptide-repeat region of PRORP domain-containing protein n=1 Tax=Brachypodium distachyon TaxID=15368 RepID=I1IYJ2_BRADI|nr:hypothetical protein BRADI_5g12557v3 [Brachypodium distachyon]
MRRALRPRQHPPPPSSLPWYAPPPQPPPSHSPSTTEADPLIVAASEVALALPVHPAPLPATAPPPLLRLLPAFTSGHFLSLLRRNPLSLPPLPILSLFRLLLLASPPGLFRHTPSSFLSMSHHLLVHRLPHLARPLLRLLASRLGRSSAPRLLPDLLPAASPGDPAPLVSELAAAYADEGLLPDACSLVLLALRRGISLPAPVCSGLMSRLPSTPEAYTFYLQLLDAGMAPETRLFNVLMRDFVRLGELVSARKVFDEMRRSVQPTVVTFNTLISGRMENAVKMFNEMRDTGVNPNAVVFTTLIDAHCKEGNVNAGMDLYQDMRVRGVMPDLVAYNALVNGLCRARNLKAAESIVEEMKNAGLKPDKVTYTTLIDGCCKDGKLDMAMDIKQKMAEKEVSLDEVTYTALISGLSKAGRPVDAERVLREMMEAALEPDNTTYTMVIDAFCRKGDVKTGFKLLKEMQNKGKKPGVVTYNVIMNGLCKLGQMKNADMLLHAMLNIGVSPDDITYNILLDGQCKHGKVANSEELESSKGMVPDFAVYTSLISELAKKKPAKNYHDR